MQLPYFKKIQLHPQKNSSCGVVGYNDMIGDEGVIITNDSAKYAGRIFEVRHSRKKASGVFQRTVPVHGRPVWDNSAIVLKKRQGQASTCGLDRNYYPEVGIYLFWEPVHTMWKRGRKRKRSKNKRRRQFLLSRSLALNTAAIKKYNKILSS